MFHTTLRLPSGALPRGDLSALSFILYLSALTGFMLVVFLATSVGAATLIESEAAALGCDRDALARLQKAAFAGNASAQFDVAMLYAYGQCVDQSPEKALTLLHNAANSGHEAALATLGAGHLVDKDGEQARSNIAFDPQSPHRAAMAQHYLALIMLRGFRDPESHQQGLELLRRSAAEGHAVSALLLGRLHETGGYGAQQDSCLSRHWYEASWALGVAMAELHLARIESDVNCDHAARPNLQ